MSEICSTCGLPKELCVCETIAKESQEITLSLESKRFGKKYTIVEGIDQKEIDLNDLTKKLKKARIISKREEHTIKRCAARADIP
jgi:translation initiation factor 1